MHYLVDFLKQFEALCPGSPQYKQSPSFHLRSFSSCISGLNLVTSTYIGLSNGISLLRALEGIDVVDAMGCKLSVLLLLMVVTLDVFWENLYRKTSSGCIWTTARLQWSSAGSSGRHAIQRMSMGSLRHPTHPHLRPTDVQCPDNPASSFLFA
jgi:hypothetical protein